MERELSIQLTLNFAVGHPPTAVAGDVKESAAHVVPAAMEIVRPWIALDIDGKREAPKLSRRDGDGPRRVQRWSGPLDAAMR